MTQTGRGRVNFGKSRGMSDFSPGSVLCFFGVEDCGCHFGFGHGWKRLRLALYRRICLSFPAKLATEGTPLPGRPEGDLAEFLPPLNRVRGAFRSEDAGEEREAGDFPQAELRISIFPEERL